MKKTTIVTSGHEFIDIDAFACICAYKELLLLKKCDVQAIITSHLNASITKKYRERVFYETNTTILDRKKIINYVLVDVSDPAHFEDFVDEDLVSHIFDHHSGFEKYWANKLGDKAIIEPLGAAATLIVREYKNEELLHQISAESAELLAVAIISNSLNFQAKITKDEDHLAYRELQKYFNYTENFAQDYFLEVQQNIERDITLALKDDGKSISEELYITQLEVWDADHIIDHFHTAISKYLNMREEQIAFANIIDLSKNRNIVIFRNCESLQWAQKHFPEFSYDEKKNVAITNHVLLRKEILAHLQKY